MFSETFYVNAINRDYVEERRAYPSVEIKGKWFLFILLGLLVVVIVIAYIQELPAVFERIASPATSETSQVTLQQWAALVCIPCFSAIFLYGTLMSEIEWRKTRDKWKRLALAGRTTIVDTQVRLFNSYTKQGKTQEVYFEFVSPKSGKIIHDSMEVYPINRQFYPHEGKLLVHGKVIYLNDNTYALL
jgi:hypothetical protein